MEPGFDSRRPHQMSSPTKYMKSLKSLITLAAVSLFAAGIAFAAAATVESKQAGCCATAAKDSKTCAHPCCVEAAKAGNNCTKCNGSGPLAKKEEAKK